MRTMAKRNRRHGSETERNRNSKLILMQFLSLFRFRNPHKSTPFACAIVAIHETNGFAPACMGKGGGKAVKCVREYHKSKGMGTVTHTGVFACSICSRWNQENLWLTCDVTSSRCIVWYCIYHYVLEYNINRQYTYTIHIYFRIHLLSF